MKGMYHMYKRKMNSRLKSYIGYVMLASGVIASTGLQAKNYDVQALQEHVIKGVDARKKLAQVINDKLFSFAEISYQESESASYLIDLLEKNGFTIERNVAGIPTGWVARWGKGKPVIAVGGDYDGLTNLSQKPGVAYFDPIVEGAPGHGEGHNSGLALSVVAALAVKDAMVKDGVTGSLVIFPGVAEEIGGGKPYMIRAGALKDVDAVLYNHVSSELGSGWGQASATGSISVIYDFEGTSAHAGAAPWLGASALDAVEIMNTAWNYRREHLRPQQRSHYVITNGGEQPNIVPAKASVWYQIREADFEHTLKNFQTANRIAEAAALATDTRVTHRIIGTAAPGHFNKVLAEVLAKNSKKVGMPVWSDNDQTFARAVQKLVKVPETGLKDTVRDLALPTSRPGEGGYSDNIGDVSWAVPTAVLGYPSNIPNIGVHTRAAAMAMATPIAHKGVVNGAKTLALSVIDLLVQPELISQAQDYFVNVQNKQMQFLPFISDTDQPALSVNKELMDHYRPLLRKFYYDEKKYDSYLDQLGIKYPVLAKPVK